MIRADRVPASSLGGCGECSGGPEQGLPTRERGIRLDHGDLLSLTSQYRGESKPTASGAAPGPIQCDFPRKQGEGQILGENILPVIMITHTNSLSHPRMFVKRAYVVETSSPQANGFDIVLTGVGRIQPASGGFDIILLFGVPQKKRVLKPVILRESGGSSCGGRSPMLVF